VITCDRQYSLTAPWNRFISTKLTCAQGKENVFKKSFIKTPVERNCYQNIYKVNSDGAKNVLVYRHNGVEAFLPGALHC
jgi:hypothetical protein